MTNVLPFTPTPTNPVRQALTDLSPGDPRAHGRIRTGNQRVDAAVRALEDTCWAEPCILPAHDGLTLDGRRERHVAVVMPRHDLRLTPAEARDAAHRLVADNAFTGCTGIAARLTACAAEAERRESADGPLNPCAVRNGGHTILALILLATAVLGLIAFA